MDGKKSKFGNNKILILLVFVLLIIAVVQSVFLFKLYRAADHSEIAKWEDSFDKHFGNQGDTLKQFDFGKQWDPFKELQSMREQMQRMFDDSQNRFKLSPFFDDSSQATILPQTDLEDKGDHYIVTMNIPGSEQSEIKVDLEGNTLIVSAQTKMTKANKNNNKFLRMERSMGSFQRSMTLPGPVDASGMETKYEDGVLTIILPKKKA